MNIFFFDIDGVFIPARAYSMPGQTKPLVTKFDPCVVGMVNRLADKFDIQFVIHSSWVRAATLVLQEMYGHNSVKQHMLNEGVKDYFHKDHLALWRFSGTRWFAIEEWLDDHPEVENYWIFEDEQCPIHYDFHRDGHHVWCDFDEGPTFMQMQELESKLIEAGVPRRVLLETEE